MSCAIGFLTVFALILAYENDVMACFASGTCGGGCAPPPPAPICAGGGGGGCGPGYGCGTYGCYRARARVASPGRTFRVAKAPLSGEVLEDDLPQERPLTPDEKFLQCCYDRQLPDQCVNKCSFRTFTRDALQAMYFRMDPCPMQAASDMQFCAAQGRDHRACCERNGVTTTLSGEKCLTFCDQRPGNVTQLDLSYLACYDRFENMKSCFWHSAIGQEPGQRYRLAAPKIFRA